MTLEQRRHLRKNATKPERLLWAQLRKSKTGVRWRRQHPCGPYILDFYCPAHRVAVELDGHSHYGCAAKEHDAARELWISSYGIRTLRYDNSEVLREPEAVAARIVSALARFGSVPRAS